MTRLLVSVLLAGLLSSVPVAAQEDGPALPEGLGGAPAADGPALPPGLGGGPEKASAGKEALTLSSRLPFDLSGFWENRLGTRLKRDDTEKHASIEETRLQLDAQKAFQSATVNVTADLVWDPVSGRYKVRLDEGTGWLDLRQANIVMSPVEFMDIKAGRQILTWGTGDLLFINDMFPKDWNSFFTGRDDEYLKAPTNAVRTSL